MGVTGFPGIVWSMVLLGCWHLLLPSVGVAWWYSLVHWGHLGPSLCARTCTQRKACLPLYSARAMALVPKYPSHSPCIKGRGMMAGTWRTL